MASTEALEARIELLAYGIGAEGLHAEEARE
jgi:hypothetical protein